MTDFQYTTPYFSVERSHSMSYLDELSEIWEAVKVSFQDQYSPSIIKLWFGDLKVSSFENNTVTLSTESEFKYKIVNEKYLPIIKEGFSKFLGFDVEVTRSYRKRRGPSRKSQRPCRRTISNTPLTTSSSETPINSHTPPAPPLRQDRQWITTRCSYTDRADWERPT